MSELLNESRKALARAIYFNADKGGRSEIELFKLELQTAISKGRMFFTFDNRTPKFVLEAIAFAVANGFKVVSSAVLEFNDGSKQRSKQVVDSTTIENWRINSDGMSSIKHFEIHIA